MRISLCLVWTLSLGGCCCGNWSIGGGLFPERPRPPVDAGPPRPPDPVPVDDSPVVEPERPPPPISGGTLAVLDDGTTVVADSDRDLVYLVSPEDQVRTLKLGKNDEPGRVTAGPRGKVFVALRRAGQVMEIDVVAGALVARHGVCPAPRGLAWLARKQTLFVACATGDLAQLGFENGVVSTLRNSHPVEDLRDVMVVDGGVLLSTFRTPNLWMFGDDRAVSALAAPGALAVSDSTSADNGKTFVPRVAWRTVSTPSGAVMVHQRAQTTALSPGLSSQGAAAPSHPYYGAPPLSPSLGSVHTVVTIFTHRSAEERAVVRSAVLPVDIAVSADESTIAIAAAATGVIRIKGGVQSLELSGPTNNLQFTSVGFRGSSIVAFAREPAQLFIRPEGGPHKIIPLSWVSVQSTGHQMFHAGTPNRISCASCHPEGGEDGHLWNLPEGPRRTPSLRGGLAGTEPFHWDGKLATMAALISDTLVTRMGGLNQSPARIAAELRWLDAQPRLASPWLNHAAVLRGAALFASPAIGCSSCHAGAQGTNNANANVGTGEALQVPRMVELAYRAPFFHDGRVATLAGRFASVGGGDLHGQVSALRPDEIDDLVAYLKSR